MRAQVGEMLKRIVTKHGPALQTFNREQLSRRRGFTFQRYKPLEDGEKT